MTNKQLRSEILEITKKVGAEESSIVCGSLFCKLTSNEMATKLKNTLQNFFDIRKANDTNVKMSGPMLENEYAYDFTPVVDFRLDEYGI